jgi:hypothetical protein
MRWGDPSEAIAFANACVNIHPYPDSTLFKNSILAATESMRACSESLRPRSTIGGPSGLLNIASAASIIVPDLHGRTGFLKSLLSVEFPEGFVSKKRKTLVQLLSEGEISVICLGDVLHSEGPEAARRWKRISHSLAESSVMEGLFSAEMDSEMGQSCKTLLLVSGLMTRFPERFFCLKGNHDNMGNLDSDGDLPFYKYAYEGIMGSEWFRLRYGALMLNVVREYELLLPLVARGRGFFASHAEPLMAIDMESLREYRTRPDIVRSLIWTENGEARKDSVEGSMRSLTNAGDSIDTMRWFAGHRPVQNGFTMRASDGFTQIHDLSKNQVVIVDDSQECGKLVSIEDGIASVLCEIDIHNSSVFHIRPIPHRT